MVEQIVPFYLLILWAAVLLSKSMVAAVRLCAHRVGPTKRFESLSLVL